MSDKNSDNLRAGAPFNFSNNGGGLDPLLIGSITILLISLLFIIYRLLRLQWDEAAARRRTETLLAMAEEDGKTDHREVQIAGGRRRTVRRRVNRTESDFVNEFVANQGQASEDEGDFDGPSYDNEEKIGARKAAKIQAKAEKKALREQELIEREQRRRREKEKEEKLDKEREKERLEEEAENERLMKEREEREKREQEEYLAMKENFAVEDEGFDQLAGEEAENLIRDFITYIKKCKVVNIDELAAHFALRSDDAVNRINCFLDNGMLQGVMDDRGKFIYISEEELEAVAKFINQRGRVSIQELADYSNMLIKLDEET